MGFITSKSLVVQTFINGKVPNFLFFCHKHLSEGKISFIEWNVIKHGCPSNQPSLQFHSDAQDDHCSNPLLCFEKPPSGFRVSTLCVTLITYVSFLYVEGSQEGWPRYHHQQLSCMSRGVMGKDPEAADRALFRLHVPPCVMRGWWHPSCQHLSPCFVKVFSLTRRRCVLFWQILSIRTNAGAHTKGCVLQWRQENVDRDHWLSQCSTIHSCRTASETFSLLWNQHFFKSHVGWANNSTSNVTTAGSHR